MVEIGSADTQEDIQEKLKNMSPEELKEFQKKQCIFCQIISGKVASKKVYSDEVCTAILDINPANPGHVLLLPNEHYAIMPLIPEDEIAHMFMVAKALSNALLKGLQAEGADIFVANGMIAGQKAQHFMIHVIPRKEGDKVTLEIAEKTLKPEDEKKVVKQLRPVITKALGGKVEEEPEEEPEKEEPEEEEPEEEPEEEELDDEEPEEAEEPAEEEEEKPKKKKSKKKPKKKKPAKKKPKKKEPKKEEPKREVGIDDIAQLLTGGGR